MPVKYYLGREGSIVALQDMYGRIWITRRKKYKRDFRRRPGKVKHIPIICICRYKLKNTYPDKYFERNSSGISVEESKRAVNSIFPLRLSFRLLIIPLEKVLEKTPDMYKKNVEIVYNKIKIL